MDLSTTYLGFALPHPLMPGSSPLADDLDSVRRLEDAGAAAIVLRSLFEEQIVGDELATYHAHAGASESHAEAMSYLPEPEVFALGTHDYLEQVQRIKAAVKVPVIASLNGTTPESWIEYARLIEQAGADALEVNVYELATDPLESGDDVEDRTVGRRGGRPRGGGDPDRGEALAVLFVARRTWPGVSSGPARTAS